jgi:hypothetical protein
MQKMISLATAGLILVSGCAPVPVDTFKGAKPDFVLEDYFEGKTRAWGLFEDRMGTVRRQFVVDITGRWNGKTLTLTENFLYNDGEKELREWSITKNGSNGYIGTTADAVGEAVGRAAGNAFHWQYDFNLAIGDGSWRVHFDDWMFLQPNGVVLNKATVSRWGIKIGTVFLSFDKRPTTDAAANDLSAPLPARDPRGSDERRLTTSLTNRSAEYDAM